MTAKSTTPEFIQKAEHVHSSRYDYSLVKYKSVSTKVVITCHNHGEFHQTPNSHLNGAGCPECVKADSRNRYAKKQAEILAEFISVHGNKYDYSKVKYVNTHTKVQMLCKDHGEFLQTPNSHLRGRGCRLCSFKGISDRQFKTTDDFINKANEVHNSTYSYIKSKYSNSYYPIVITCSTHGDFKQRPNDHLCGAGCPVCAKQVSKPEIEVGDFIESLGLDIIRNTRAVFKNSKKEADILIPSKKVIVEYNGSIWHSTAKNKNRYNIRDKTKIANDNGYKCIHIRDDQWLHSKDLVKELLKSQLGIFTNRIGARQTIKKNIGDADYKLFAEHNHLQGYRPAKYKKGLFYNNELVAAISYDNAGELIRYIVKHKWQIIGALPKLIKNENIVFSFCDLTFFDGKSYPKAGFILDSITKPNYRYTKGGYTISRNSMMKHKLKDKITEFDGALTEEQNCNNNGWYRLYDCGNAKYVMPKPTS
jgi:hypothetical protein